MEFSKKWTKFQIEDKIDFYCGKKNLILNSEYHKSYSGIMSAGVSLIHFQLLMNAWEKDILGKKSPYEASLLELRNCIYDNIPGSTSLQVLEYNTKKRRIGLDIERDSNALNAISNHDELNENEILFKTFVYEFMTYNL